MEGWVKIKGGSLWQKRYGFISQQGSFRYFDDQTMTELKRDFRLNDVQIVQDRIKKIIKLQGINENLQIKTDLHELWYQKLIQARAKSMNISYIPQFQDQNFIRMNEQRPKVQFLEQQNIDPNDAVRPRKLRNRNKTNQKTNMQLQGDQYQACKQQNQIRTNQLQNQSQVFQEENKQNGLQQLAQYPNQQITHQQNIPQSIYPSNQIQPQNNLNAQNRTNQLQNQNQVFQEENKQNGLQQLTQYPNQQITHQQNIPQSIYPSNQIQPQNNLNALNRTNQLQNQNQVFQEENRQNGLLYQRSIPQSMNQSNQIQPQNNLNAQNRSNQLSNQNQVFQEENRQNGLQYQRNIPQSMNPSNQIQPQSNLNTQNRTNQLSNQNQVFQEENRQNGLQYQRSIPQSMNQSNQIQPQNNLNAQYRSNQLSNQNQVFYQQTIRQGYIPQSMNPSNQIQPQSNLNTQNRTNQLSNQNQVFQEENRQNGLYYQRNILQSMNPSNQIQPQNNLNAQNNQFKRDVDNKFEKYQQQQKQHQIVFSNFKYFIIGKNEDYYDEKFVSELNSNINLKMQAKQKIDEIILPITTQTSLFNQEQNNSTIQYNFNQYIQLQNIFDQQRNTFPLKMSLSIFLMFIIMYNLIQWQKKQLIYTFCCIIISQLCVLFKHLKSKQVAIKCNVQAFTAIPLNISEMYTINQLLEKLCQINKNIIIFEQEKNKELFILDKNIEFESVYQIQIKNSKIFSIKIFTKNYEYLDSIIENFTSNFTSKTGIWKESQQRPPTNYNPVLDAIEQKMQIYFSEYQVNKKNVKDPNWYICVILYIIKIIYNNWQFSYEIFCLILLLLRLKNQQEQFNWSYYSNWFLLINYGIAFTKITFYLEEIFLSLRTDIKKYITINEKAYNYYYKKDIYKIAFNQEEIQTQDKINDFEVQFLCVSLFASFVFSDFYNVIQIILFPALKPIFLKRYPSFYQETALWSFIITCSLLIVIFDIFMFIKSSSFGISLQILLTNFFESIKVEIQNQLQQLQQEQQEQQECSICFENYQPTKEQAFFCKNKHYFHTDCITKWMNSGDVSATKQCPVCRVDLLI
ncbi:C3HC4 type (RING finger) zinc finger protein (macronuclear) [Tetrahymena thermophila SB210]|uniref:C3HC4 type (RING finger) zinc finger protein n=1 Tax=Tetrahymena thermophila (strain SB210) TaxID=312017 RepID=W7XGU2_TETTS|nr:C3HC4 type (RING finger) zinc finger protein [Tetrahymena thermophila SB210]EWS73446.1 C3HC4 type (RING finger) zinc finger protein [Tetrahymena thermophila SB210]|eukprot:XP_012654017.1 C3HC4 type (RING finger) zinc finger protein [Tetrahymena thermophila SB210]